MKAHPVSIFFLCLVFFAMGCQPPPGKQQRTLPDGSKATWNITDGRLHGPLQILYKDGQKKEVSQWQKGRLNGKWQSWHANGKQAQSALFQDHKLHGLYQRWDKDGKRRELIHWKDGKMHGHWNQWNALGDLQFKARFHKGKLQGLVHSFSRSGEERSQWKDGKLHALWRRYYQNGKKHYEGHYLNGKRHGVWKRWSFAGKLILKVQVRNDKPIKASSKEQKMLARFPKPHEEYLQALPHKTRLIHTYISSFQPLDSSAWLLLFSFVPFILLTGFYTIKVQRAFANQSTSTSQESEDEKAENVAEEDNEQGDEDNADNDEDGEEA